MIGFYCIHCGARVQADAAFVGQLSVCPSCQGQVEIPGNKTITSLATGGAHLAEAALQEDVSVSCEAAHSFRCPTCRNELHATSGLVGQLLDCVHCAATVMVPAQMNLQAESIRMPVKSGERKREAKPVRNPGLIVAGIVAALFLVLLCINELGSSPKVSARTRPPVAREQSMEEVTHAFLSQYDGTTCRICNGSGQSSPGRCSQCQGRGNLSTPSGYAYLCNQCQGSGRCTYPCHNCNGTGVFRWKQ